MAIPQKPIPKQDKRVSYQPKTRVSKPKNTGGGEFIEKKSLKNYKGKYVEDFTGKFYAGSKIEDNGVELEKIKTGALSGAKARALGLLAIALRGFFKKKPSQSDLDKGTTKRYFVQDKNDNKIVETDKDLYQQARKLLINKQFAEVEWDMKGPAQDRIINGYPFEGAASKNKKAIHALEKQMPGISTFITDYAYLVQEPVVIQPQDLTTQTFIEKDHNQQVQEDRKANFDYKK